MSRARRRTTIPFGNEKRRKRVIGNVSKRNNPHEVYGQRTDKARIGTNSKKFPSEIAREIPKYKLKLMPREIDAHIFLRRGRILMQVIKPALLILIRRTRKSILNELASMLFLLALL